MHIPSFSRLLVLSQWAVTLSTVAAGTLWAISIDEQTDPHGEVRTARRQESTPPIAQETEHRSRESRTTVFIVDSEESAAVLRSSFRETDAFRMFAGLPAVTDEVLVARDRVEADFLFAALTREAAILATTEMRELVVIAVE